VSAGPSPATARRVSRTRRLVIAFLVIVAVAGILAVAAPDDGNGAPLDPETAGWAAR